MKKAYLLIILLVMHILQVTYAANSQASSKFISFADIHFDPFNGCDANVTPCPIITQLRESNIQEWPRILERMSSPQLAHFGQDTNYALFKSMLGSLSHVNDTQKPEFGLIIGDFLAHDFRRKYSIFSGDTTAVGYANFVRKIMAFITTEIHQVLPKLNVFGVVGNNDSYTGDYDSIPRGQFFADTAKNFTTLINDKKNIQSLQSTFSYAGYYAVTPSQNKDLKIVILNSVLFSIKADVTTTSVAASKQLKWFHQQLASAQKNHQYVLVSFHIPLGVDVYATLKNKLQGVKSFWRTEYNDAFEKELKLYPHIVKEILPAHIHMDAFQIVTLNEVAKIPISFTPSISPIFGNNPALKVFTYNPKTFDLINYETYYLPLNKTIGQLWGNEYSFNQIYQPECQYCNLVTGMKRLVKTNKFKTPYQLYYAVQGSQLAAIDQYWAPYYRCNIRSISMSGFNHCIKN